MADGPRIDVETVRAMAGLAQIQIGEQDAAALAPQLRDILAYVDKLREVNVDGVAGTAHALDVSCRMRSDDVQIGLPQESALANAPEVIHDAFGVPKIID